MVLRCECVCVCGLLVRIPVPCVLRVCLRRRAGVLAAPEKLMHGGGVLLGPLPLLQMAVMTRPGQAPVAFCCKTLPPLRPPCTPPPTQLVSATALTNDQQHVGPWGPPHVVVTHSTQKGVKDTFGVRRGAAAAPLQCTCCMCDMHHCTRVRWATATDEATALDAGATSACSAMKLDSSTRKCMLRST